MQVGKNTRVRDLHDKFLATHWVDIERYLCLIVPLSSMRSLETLYRLTPNTRPYSFLCDPLSLIVAEMTGLDLCTTHPFSVTDSLLGMVGCNYGNPHLYYEADGNAFSPCNGNGFLHHNERCHDAATLSILMRTTVVIPILSPASRRILIESKDTEDLVSLAALGLPHLWEGHVIPDERNLETDPLLVHLPDTHHRKFGVTAPQLHWSHHRAYCERQAPLGATALEWKAFVYTGRTHLSLRPNLTPESFSNNFLCGYYTTRCAREPGHS